MTENEVDMLNSLYASSMAELSEMQAQGVPMDGSDVGARLVARFVNALYLACEHAYDLVAYQREASEDGQH